MNFENEGEVFSPNETQENETVTVADQVESEPEKPETETAETSEENENKTFTQEMVDEIVRNRLERDRKATYKRYGVESKEGLDELIGKSQSYSIIKERYEKLKNENGSLKEKMAFLTNNINPAREEDVRAYFKGKEIEFNEENLINELATHPEWLNVKENDDTPKTTIKVLGVEHGQVLKQETEDERRKRIFGV